MTRLTIEMVMINIHNLKKQKASASMNEKQIRWRTLLSRVTQKNTPLSNRMDVCSFSFLPYHTDTHDSHIVKHGREHEEEEE